MLIITNNLVAKIFPIFSKVPSGDDVDMMIDKVEKAVLNMKERSEILSEAILIDIHKQNAKHHDRLHTALNMTRATAASTSAGLHIVGRQVSQIEDTLQPMPQKMDVLQNSVAELREDIVASERAIVDGVTAMANRGALDAQNWMLGMLTEIRQGFETRLTAMEQKQDKLLRGAAQLLELEQFGSRTPRLLQSTQQPLLGPKQLLEILAVPPEALIRDLDYVVRQGLHLSPAEQGQAQSLMRMDRFWMWFTSVDSDMLHVGGSLMDPSQHQLRVSSLSAVCATIVASITQRNADATALHYFCGLHVSSNDALKGPQGLMRCLTSRLLVELQGKYGVVPNLTFLDAGSIERLQYHNLEQLCDLFCRLIMQFESNTTIYCMIDGICWFERQDMLEDLFRAVQSIHAMVDDPGKRVTLKVLLTSPLRSRHIAQALDMQRRITLQAEPLLLAGALEPLRPGRHDLGITVRPRRAHTPSQEEELTVEDYR